MVASNDNSAFQQISNDDQLVTLAATDSEQNQDIQFYNPAEFFNSSYDLCPRGSRGRGLNSSLCFLFSFVNRSDEMMRAMIEDNYWSLILLVFPLLTVFGNVLVVLGVFREKSLRTVTNYFIVSLAVADIMVAILVMPLAVYVQV